MQVRILVVDDHEIVRAGLRSVFARLPWVERCVGAGDCEGALNAMRRYEPHLALVDLYLGGEAGLDICHRLAEHDQRLRLVLMSGTGCVTPAVARTAGATGFVSKAWPTSTLIEAVRLAMDGRPIFTKMNAPSPGQALTERERDVLRELMRGLSNPEVAAELNLSRHTVKQHTSALYRKLGVRNRAEAASHAQRLGLAA